MVFTNITFKHTNTDTNYKTDELVTQKLATLGKYIDEGTESICEVEYERIPSHQSGPVCRLEVNVWLGAVLYRAETTTDTFESAIDVVRNELDQEMRRAHKKHNSLIRKGGRKIKEMMRGW